MGEGEALTDRFTAATSSTMQSVGVLAELRRSTPKRSVGEVHRSGTKDDAANEERANNVDRSGPNRKDGSHRRDGSDGDKNDRPPH